MKIKSRELIFGSAVLLQGSSFLLNILIHSLSYEVWAAFLIALVLAVPAIVLYMRTNIYEETGKVISWIYIIFFILIASYNINLLSSFVNEYILEETPRWIFIILFTALCVYAVSGGAERLFGLAILFFAVALISDIINIFLLRNTIQVQNLLPLFRNESQEYIRGIFAGVMFLLCDMAIFMCFPKEKGKGLLWGYLVGGILLLLVCFRTAATLGITSGVFTWPTHEALRLIDSKNAVTRIETSSVFVMIALVFFKISIILSGVKEGVEKLTGINKAAISLTIGATAAIISGLLFNTAALSMDFALMWGGVIILPFAVVFPLIGRALKRKNKKIKKSVDKGRKVC